MRYWIKLWVDFVDDDKMGVLPEFIQLRFLKLCLIADESGLLPPVARIAWRLRLEQEQVAQTLAALREVRVADQNPDGSWVIVNFAKRQAPFTSTERSRNLRMQRERNTDATISLHIDSASVPSSDDSVSLIPREDSKNSEFKGAEFQVYEQNIGILTPMIAEAIQAAQDEYPPGWIEKAILEAVEHNKRSWSYCEAILKRWKIDGPRTGSRSNGSKPGQGMMVDNVKRTGALERARQRIEAGGKNYGERE